MNQAAPPGERRADSSGAGQHIAGRGQLAAAGDPSQHGRGAGRPAERTSWRRPVLLLCLLAGLLVLAVVLSTGQLRRALTGQLDRQVRSASDRYAALMADPSENDHDADDNFDLMVGPAAGTLGSLVADGRLQSAAVLGRGSAVPGSAGERLASLRPRPGIRTVALPGLGSYRLAVRGSSGRFEAVGLPLRSVSRTVDAALAGEAALAAGILAVASWLSVRSARRTRRAEHRPAVDEAGLRALLAEAGHELRTPAAVIHSYAELAEQSGAELPPSVDRALQRIESESERMGRMVEELLVLSRFEGGYRPALTEVDLTKLALDAVDDARVARRQDRWQLLVPDQPVGVIGNAHWLFQAVAALLANVRAHTPPGTTVRIGLRTAGGVAELSIADNGPGIPPEILPAVFDRFVRTDDAARYDGMIGIGLGLSVVGKIVQAHGGSVSVDSSPAGTEFVLRLPLAAGWPKA